MPAPAVTPPPSSRYHLHAALLSLGLFGVLAVFAISGSRAVQCKYIHTIAAELSDQKLQGAALQKCAFSQPDLLVLYGSSELVKNVPNKASEFFQEHPSGFQVFPVGKAGTTSLAILQKLVAVGGDLRGRKVAFSLSPSYFFSETLNPDYYRGNFSELQASLLVGSDAISPELKKAAVCRMLEYPETVKENWLLEFAMERLARDTAMDRVLGAVAWPVLKLENAVGIAQDHVSTALHIIEQDVEVDRPDQARPINWRQHVRNAEALAKKLGSNGVKHKPIARGAKGSKDRSFLQSLDRADEWTDFELVLQALQELGAKPLLLSMPLHAADLETTGVSADARKSYGKRLEQLSQRYQTPLVYFSEHESDPTFFADHLDHPGVKGWIYYNKMLDDFFHGRPLARL